MRSAITRSLLVAAAATSLLGLQAAPASAETTPSCRYQDCNGQLPEAAGCNDPATTSTIASFRSGDTLVELRYSSACEAAWARATGPGEPGQRCDGWTDNSVIRIEGEDWNGPGTASFDGCSRGDQAWSAMVGFDYNVRACLVTQQFSGSGESDTSRGCTAWH